MKSKIFSICILLFVILYSITSLKANNNVLDSDSTSSSNKKIYFTLKYGQGGFSDSRSPLDKLGGGQLAICAQHKDYPIAISLSTEYYTNSAGPTNPYEISDMNGVNIFYSRYFLKKDRINLFAGPGIGYMLVPQNENENAKSIFYNIEAGINAKLLWKFGLYATYKYLYAQKNDLVDFSEHILLIGITFNFKL